MNSKPQNQVKPCRGLLIAGHGSAKIPNARKPICACVQAIRALGIYDEVRCALWKEDPHFSTVYDRMESPDITVVPFFISAGYYTEQIIPEHMSVDAPPAGRSICVSRPLGDDAGFADLVIQRAREAGATGSETLVVLGHGTPRNKKSAENVYRQTDRVRERDEFPEVITVFLDQEPNMLNLWDMTDSTAAVMVPLFIADGWHVAETIPEELAEAGVSTREDRDFLYTRAVGTDPELYKVVLQLAQEAEDLQAAAEQKKG